MWLKTKIIHVILGGYTNEYRRLHDILDPTRIVVEVGWIFQNNW